MQFKTFSKEEIENDDRLGPGTYEYKVIEALETTSKAGNEMLKIFISLYGSDGSTVTIHDYLVSTVRWKLKQFAKSCGMLEKLEGGELSEMDILNKKGMCEIGLEKTEKGEFLRVKKYLPLEDLKEENVIEDDDLPF